MPAPPPSPWILTLAGPLLLAVPVAAGTPTFTEQPQFGASGSTIPVAWGDADRDGDVDLAVGNFFDEQNYLYVNEGADAFTELTRFGQKDTFVLLWGDYDNDGDLDMAVGNGTLTANRLITNNGGLTFSGAPTFGANSTVAMAWADVDEDGDLDLAVGNGILNAAQQNYLYRNDGGGTFEELPEFGLRETCTLGWADYDGDGDPDLAAGNGGFHAEDQNYLYRNDGGTFVEQAQFGMGDTSCLIWGDSDNDGDLDLAVANWDGGQNYLYVNNGDGSFTELARFGMRDPNTMAWGDADNDGDLDLAVGNGDFGSADQNYLYVNEGGNVFTESAQFGLGSTDAVAWADHDGDGDLDLAVGNEHHTRQNYLYRNEENDGDHLLLALQGRFHDLGSGYSNRDGVGAEVSVYDEGLLGDPAHLLGFRQVEARGGFASQNSPDVHFGLPGHAAVDVRIEWPGSGGSGITQDLTSIPVGGRYPVDEEDGVVTAVPPTDSAPAPRSTWRIAPNPTRAGTTIELASDRRPATAVEIYDATGRRVRGLSATVEGARSRVHWDGRDDAGRPVASGVYYARAAGTGAPGSDGIVILR